ncbi:MAG TPA: cysteine--tRNA ligase [Chloroflexota bacterium]
MPVGPPLYLTNTYGRQLEEFHSLEPGRVKMYTCGPTVYSYAHIGNFRAYIFADILRRVLEYNGYQVTQVRNITDVGHLTNDTLSTGLDKIEAAARSQNASPWDIARHVTQVFLEDARRLNIETPEYTPRATDYIGPMIGLVELLVERGYAYSVDGDVYYDVSQFPRYGALSGNSVADLIGGHRVEVGEGKRSPEDFAIWRGAEPDKLMRWPSPWGEGVPGWHLECSAMAIDLLGPELDIHTGGEDHIFPHHEDEVAQSEGATGRRFARYWLHNAFLQLGDDEKMSKSQGNIYTLSDVEARGIAPLAYRYFTLQAHYRTPLSFSWEALEAAQTGLTRVWEAVAELVQAAGEHSEALGPEAEQLRTQFHEAINRDLDMPVAVSVLHEALGAKLPAGQKLALLQDMDLVLGLDLLSTGRIFSETTEEQRGLLEARSRARADKNWKQSDELRARLNSLGLDVRDTAQGQRWVRRDLLAAGHHNGEHETG